MAEWKPEYDNVPTVKRRGDRPEGPDSDLAKGTVGCAGAIWGVFAVLAIIVFAFVSMLLGH